MSNLLRALCGFFAHLPNLLLPLDGVDEGVDPTLILLQ
jgi:hypothetical protein